MRVTDFTKEALRVRRAHRELKAKGYERIDGPWELHRGGYRRFQQRIVDVVIDPQGKDVWVKCEEPSDTTTKAEQRRLADEKAKLLDALMLNIPDDMQICMGGLDVCTENRDGTLRRTGDMHLIAVSGVAFAVLKAREKLRDILGRDQA